MEYVDRPVEVIKHVDRPVVEYVDRPYEVIKEVEVIREVDRPVVEYVDRPYEVIKEVQVPVTQIVEKEVIKYVDRPAAAPVTHTHTHSGGHGFVEQQGPVSYGSGYDGASSNAVQSAPNYADCPSGTTQQADGTCLEAYSEGYSSGYSVPETVVTPSSSGQYCYGNSGKSYDSFGKEIKGGHTTTSDCRH